MENFARLRLTYCRLSTGSEGMHANDSNSSSRRFRASSMIDRTIRHLSPLVRSVVGGIIADPNIVAGGDNWDAAGPTKAECGQASMSFSKVLQVIFVG